MAQRDFSFHSVVTAVISAAVFARLVVVMVAVNLRIVAETSRQQRLHRIVGAAGHAAIEPDARIRQRRLRAAANAAADQCVGPMPKQEACQRAMSAVAGIHHLCGSDLAVLHLIQLKLCRMSKMLINLPILIGYRDFHIIISFL